MQRLFHINVRHSCIIDGIALQVTETTRIVVIFIQVVAIRLYERVFIILKFLLFRFRCLFLIQMLCERLSPWYPFHDKFLHI